MTSQISWSVTYRKASIEVSFLVILLLKKLKNVMNSLSLPSSLLQSEMSHFLVAYSLF